ncbi:hypothetical protein FOVG_18912 [Fusarium oxysporum f. sp. pisi HDV247]|nr:hypothetical protein FOVG_18912 [Fusarium oxysporum f. sp. pisi HDV247]
MASPEKQQNGPPSQSPEKQEPAVAGDNAEEGPKPKPTRLKRFMDKIGLDAPTLILMFKSDPLKLPFASSRTAHADVFLLSAEAPSLL